MKQRDKLKQRCRRTAQKVEQQWQGALSVLILVLVAGCGGDGGNATAPAAPSNVQAEAQPGFVRVTWEDNSSNETGFVIYRASEGAADFTRIGEVAADETVYRDDDALELDQTYLYGVTALNGDSESTQVQIDPSDSVTPRPGEPTGATLPVSIVLAGPGRGTVSSQDGRLNCDEPGAAGCTASFEVGTSVTLSADANAGAAFESWSGEGCDGADTCDLTVDAESDSNGNGRLDVTVTFSQTGYGLLLRKEGSGGGTFQSSPGGIDCGDDCEEAYPLAAEVPVRVGFGRDGIAIAEGSLFNAWGGDCPNRDVTDTCTVRMNENRTVIVYLSKPANDSYEVGSGRSLSVSASDGLLNNDLLGGAEAGRDLRVTEVSQPENGSLTLAGRDNGSFAYTPDAGFSGTDTFTYQVTDLRGNTARATVTLTVSAAPQVRLTVEKQGDGAGTVTSQPGGIGCGDDCDQSYPVGTVVSLSATPAEGSSFAGWGGACAGSGACEVTLSETRNVTATFNEATPQPFTLTVEKQGDGGGTVTSQPAGITCGDTCAAEYAAGTLVTLSAVPTGDATFAGWGGACGSTGTCEVTMSQAQNVTATFTAPTEPQPFTLTVRKAGDGAGTVTSQPAGIACGDDCAETYAAGTTVSLSAQATEGSTFTAWGGACSGAEACEVTVDQAREVTATFTRAEAPNEPPTAASRTVTRQQGETNNLVLLAEDPDGDALTYIIVDRPGKGTLGSLDGDSVVTYTADANATGEDGFTFRVNDGQADSNLATMTLIITNRLTVASAPNGRVVTVDTPAPAGDCSGAVENADLCGDYPANAEVTLQAQPDEGFFFSGWTGDCAGEPSDTCTLTMDSVKTVSATFAQQPAQTFDVNVRVRGAGSGRVVSDPTGIDCLRREDEGCTASFASGTSVSLTAEAADTTSAFRDWRRDCRGDDLTCTLTVDEDKEVTARFQNNLQGDE